MSCISEGSERKAVYHDGGVALLVKFLTRHERGFARVRLWIRDSNLNPFRSMPSFAAGWH